MKKPKNKYKFFIAKKSDCKNEMFFYENNTNLQKMQNITIKQLDKFNLLFLNTLPDVFFNINYEVNFNKDVLCYDKLYDLIGDFLYNYSNDLPHLIYFKDSLIIRIESLMLNYLVFKIDSTDIVSLVAPFDINECIIKNDMDTTNTNDIYGSYDNYSDEEIDIMDKYNDNLFGVYKGEIEKLIISGLSQDKIGTLIINDKIETIIELKDGKLVYKNKKFLKQLNSKMVEVVNNMSSYPLFLKTETNSKDTLKSNKKYYKLFGFLSNLITDNEGEDSFLPKMILKVNPIDHKSLNGIYPIPKKDNEVFIYCDTNGNVEI